MGYITRLFLALLNFTFPITDWDIKAPAAATTTSTSTSSSSTFTSTYSSSTSTSTSTSSTFTSRLSTSTSRPSNIVKIFALETQTGPGRKPRIQGVVIRVHRDRPQTQYQINCPELFLPNLNPDPPCNYLDGAMVTVNPTGMTLDLYRNLGYVVARPTTINGTEMGVVERSSHSVTGTATCGIHGSTLAFCKGHVTSAIESGTTVINERGLSWGSDVTITEVVTISTTITDVVAHMVPVTFNGWFPTTSFTYPSTSTSAPTTTTTSLNSGGQRQTGQAYAIVAGAIALVGLLF